MGPLCTFVEDGGKCRCSRCGFVMPNRGGCHRCRHFCDAQNKDSSGFPPQELTPEQKAEREKHFRLANRKGPGYHLHRLIKRLTGEDVSPNCKCKARISEMNVRGPQWCRGHIDTIVAWLEEEIDVRGQRTEDRGQNKPGWMLKLAAWRLPGKQALQRQALRWQALRWQALRWLILKAVKRAEREPEAALPTRPESSKLAP